VTHLLPWCLIAFLACSDATPAPTPEADDSARRAERIERAGRIADRLMEELEPFVNAPALSGAVVVDGEIAWTDARGWANTADSVRATADSRFRLASVSKLFAATLALKLIEDGVLDPDADIREYVPAWPDHGGAVITARQLAAHTAGINHYESLASSDHVAGRHYPDIFETLSFFSNAPLLAPPGEAYSYSSFGYALLNAVTEGASGLTLAEGLDSLVFRPTGIAQTSLEDVRALPPDAVALYRADDDGVPFEIDPNDQSFVWGATGMRSTAADLARMAYAFLSGGLVSPETRDMALTPARLNDGSTVAEDRYAIGFGWRIGEDWDGRRVAHHAGSTPGARTILLGYPDDGGAAVSLVVNGTWTSRVETTAELLAAAFLEPAAGSAVGPGSECPAGEWTLDGSVDTEPERATLFLLPDGDLCVGLLTSEGYLAERFGDLAPARTSSFPLVRVAERDGAHVYAMAYPWGLAALRVQMFGDDVRVTGDVVGWLVRLMPGPQ
jgi:CubicO group peptidase (beta-lactamase class C family)